MPVEIRDLNINLTGEEANQLFFEPVYMDADIRSQFRFIQVGGISKKRLAFVQELEKIVRRHVGCGFQPIGNTRIYERFIEVDRVKADTEICWEEFKDTVYESLLGQGLSLTDVSGTLIGTVAENLVRNAIKKDNTRLAFWGDRDSTDAAYSVTDGFWSAIIPELVTAGHVTRLDTDTGNALSAGDGIEYLRKVWAQSDRRLKGLPRNMCKFYVTGAIFEQYMEDIENGGGGDAGIQLLQDGREIFQFRGYEVVPMYEWDAIQAADFSEDNPHHILFTTPMNMALGGDVLDSESQMRIWYDEEQETVKMKARYKMGFNIIHPSLVSVGY